MTDKKRQKPAFVSIETWNSLSDAQKDKLLDALAANNNKSEQQKPTEQRFLETRKKIQEIEAKALSKLRRPPNDDEPATA